MKFGFVGIVVLGFIGGSASTSLAAIEAVVSVEFLNDMNSVITEIDPGDPFWMRVSVDGPAAGLSQGYIDVTVSSAEITFDKSIWAIDTDELPPHYINELLPYKRTGFARSILQDALPQFSNFGGQTLPGLSGFAANGDWWFKTRCDGITTPGTLTADTGQEDSTKLFNVYGGSQLTQEQVDFTTLGSAQLTILPEPTTMSLLAMGGLSFLYRRKNRQ